LKIWTGSMFVVNEEDYIRYLENKIKTLENERKNLLLKLNY